MADRFDRARQAAPRRYEEVVEDSARGRGSPSIAPPASAHAPRGRGGGSRIHAEGTRAAASERPRSPRPSLSAGRAGAVGPVPAAQGSGGRGRPAGGSASAVRPPLGSDRRRRPPRCGRRVGCRSPAHGWGRRRAFQCRSEQRRRHRSEDEQDRRRGACRDSARPDRSRRGVDLGREHRRPDADARERAHACECGDDHPEQPDPDRGRRRRRGGMGRPRPPRKAVARRSAVRPGDDDARRRGLGPTTAR